MSQLYLNSTDLAALENFDVLHGNTTERMLWKKICYNAQEMHDIEDCTMDVTDIHVVSWVEYNFYSKDK